MNHFSEFVASLESVNISVDQSKLSDADRVTIGQTYGNVKSFLQEQNLVSPHDMGSLESFDTNIRSFNQAVALADIGVEAIIDLCRNCGIQDRYLKSATESVALCINNYSNSYGIGQHFEKSAPSASTESLMLNGMYSATLVSDMSTASKHALESFGSDMTNVITDAKSAITVAILRYHRSIIHRMVPNIPTDQNMVMYKVDHMEVYDLTKSRSDSGAIRNDDSHRIPFIDLYRDPNPANTKLKPIILRTANDAVAPNNKLIAENIVKIGQQVNMFDLALDVGQIGYQHIDYTDLVADNVRIKTLFLLVTDGSVTEQIPVNVYDSLGSRMMMSANNRDSAERVCASSDVTALTNATRTIGGATSTLLAGLSADGVARIKYSMSGQVHLRTSEVFVHGSANATLATVSGNAPIAADVTLFGTLTITLIGYEMHAEFSEENVRKSTKAMRVLTKQVGYEIPASSNYLVQYSLTQTRPEVVIDGLTKLMSIGMDDRGIDTILDCMNGVYDRINSEAALASDNYVHKIGQDFVAGQRVNPYIFIDTLTIPTDLHVMRSGEKWGDLRGLVEEFLLNVFSRLNQFSYYNQELGQGEKPVFNVLTSGPIKSALLSVPHYHNHLGDNAADRVDDGAVEYRRTLPDGTVMNVISTTFSHLADRMIIIPVRPSAPQSVLNFARNAERGAFVASASISQENALFNTLVANSREMLLCQNPVGAIISIAGLHRVFSGVGALGI
jgi:hypothetical protein